MQSNHNWPGVEHQLCYSIRCKHWVPGFTSVFNDTCTWEVWAEEGLPAAVAPGSSPVDQLHDAMAHKNGWGNSEVLLPISLGNIGSQILKLGWGAKSFSQKSAVLGPQFLKTQVSVWTGLQDVSIEVTGISKM